MSEIQIKDWYEHKQPPSIFIMFTSDYEVVWTYSGNELRRAYLENPENYISEPIEVPIPPHLYSKLSKYTDDF